ncbi:MAG: metal-dependent transcriptional regulator [Vicingaceae bacterium]
MLSLTEENYLKSIFVLNLEKSEGASTNAIAEKLNTKASSVSDMLKRLLKKEMIHYKKYQAVKLTDSGKAVAVSILRKHRLWEHFLVEKLHFKWDEVHDVAEQLEHIRSKKLTDQLDAFLGHPKFDPHGDPIPDKEGNFPVKMRQTLDQAIEGQEVLIVGVKDHSSEFFNYLERLEIELGTKLKVKTINQFDASMEIEINQNETTTISSEVAQNLFVK